MASQAGSTSELYNLRWNSYFTNLINIFSDHQNKESLVDVTLSCEGQFIKVHKLVLSACSVYFQKMFEIHSSPHLLIVLNDVKFKDLQLVVQFMYKGEVKVADADMQNFLQVGKLLQIKGLSSVELQDKHTAATSENKIPQLTLAEDKSNKTAESSKSKEIPQIAKKRKLSTSSPTPTPPPIVEITENANKAKKITKTPPPPPENHDFANIPRPPNAFMIFANQWRKKLQIEYPKESNKEISVRLGNMWKSLSQETKDAFYEDARKAEEEHKQKYPGGYRQFNTTKERNKVTPAKPDDDELIEVKFEENGGGSKENTTFVI